MYVFNPRRTGGSARCGFRKRTWLLLCLGSLAKVAQAEKTSRATLFLTQKVPLSFVTGAFAFCINRVGGATLRVGSDSS